MDRRALVLRYVIGFVLALAGGLLILHISDYVDPLADPTSLAQLNLPFWGAALLGLGWWCLSGAVIGALATLPMIRTGDNAIIEGMQVAASAAAVMVLILTLFKFFPYPNEFTWQNVAFTFLINIFFYAWFATLPMLFAIVIFTIVLTSLFGSRRSALDLMPPNLRAEYQAKLEEDRHHLSYRLMHPFERNPRPGAS